MGSTQLDFDVNIWVGKKSSRFSNLGKMKDMAIEIEWQKETNGVIVEHENEMGKTAQALFLFLWRLKSDKSTTVKTNSTKKKVSC